MNFDIDVKKTRINCYRQSKIPGEFMLQLRVPGGLINAKWLSFVQHLCEDYGNGTFHIGTRQTLNVPGITYDRIPSVNEEIKEYIEETDIQDCNVDMELSDAGYPTIGTRNITACIGNSHCIKSNYNTWELAKKLEHQLFPSHYHIKLNMAGCPNDCNKAHLCDFGVIGIAKMEYDYERCIGCGACVDACQHHCTGVLKLNEMKKVEKDECCCIGCAECVLSCPTGAWKRKPTKFYRILIGGRTGRQTPRLGKTWIQWVTEDVLIQIMGNWNKFSAWVMDYKPLYLHGGHLIDRAGYHKFKELMLEGITLNPEAKVADNIFWTETEYKAQFNVKPMDQHHLAGPGSQDSAH